MDRDLSEDDSVADLSFEADSPLGPPAELLEGLPSCDWLLQRDRGQVFFPMSASPEQPWELVSWSSFLEHRGPSVTEEVAREALLSFVNSQCCYGNAAARDLIIQELRQETLVRECHKCHGRGRYKCSGCYGAGMVRCSSCSGTKRKARQPRRCHMCSGSGRRRCSTCSGRGNKTCTTCQGAKKLVHFAQLVIMWKNSLSEFVPQHQLHCPTELLTQARGENLFRDENSLVYPIVDFPLREISLASQRAIADHSAVLTSHTRILQQRQTVELIPVTEVRYWYQGKNSVFYVYGTDRQVYAADYPQQYCCGGCTIL